MPASKVLKPEQPCRHCGGTEWWWEEANCYGPGRWNCVKCIVQGPPEMAPPKPDTFCMSCRGKTWWWRRGVMGKGPGDWVCGTCHPDPDPEHYKEPIIKYPKGKQPAPGGVNPYPGSPQEVKGKGNSALAVVGDAAGGKDRPGESLVASPLVILKQRVAAGNLKLIAAWEQIKDLMEDEFEPAFVEWQAALEKLSQLCEDLKLMGFEDCFYIENNVKTRECTNRAGDIVCWACPSKRKYWDEELFVGARRHVRHPIKFPIDFLKTLGGKV